MKFAALSALVLSVAAPAFAEDAQSLYDQAVQAYEGRADQAVNQQVIDLLARAQPAAEEDSDLIYNIRILKTRAIYWKGMNVTTVEAKKEIFLLAMNTAKEAAAHAADYAEAPYYAAISLGRWAEANGVLASLQRAPELMGFCRDAVERITVEGELGETVDSYGPARTLGRVYLKLPGFAGGSIEKSRQYLEEAASKGPEHVLNVVYLAEVLNGGNSADKVRARTMLDAMLARTPAQINPRRLPEMVEELRLARELRASMGN